MSTRAVTIREVGPRDGLQAEAPVDTLRRIAFARSLAETGLSDVEAASFVSPKAVPAMAGGADVIDGLPPRAGTTWWALVPNRRGVELAREAGVDNFTVTVSVSDGYSRRNVGRSADDAIEMLPDLLAEVASGTSDVVLSCAFGSPYEDVAARDVVAIVGRVRAAGATRVTLADTTGVATPARIRSVLDLVGVDVGMHLHDTRGTALANALAAFDLGVSRFDTAVGGLGGSPFAPGAGGNLATEDLVLVLEDMGVTTGVDLGALLQVAAAVPDLVGHPVPGRVATAGPLPRFGP